MLTLRSLLLLLLLPLTSLAAKRPSTNKFADYHANALSSSPVKLDDRSYVKLTTAPRNYSAAVLLTALDARYMCKPCHDFQGEWQLLARSWIAGDRAGESRLVFGTLDVEEGREIFQKLGLQSVPVLMLFHPTTGPGAKVDDQPSRYDFTAAAPTAEMVHSWITRNLPESQPHPPVRRPVNYVKIIVVTTTILAAITFATVAYPHIAFILNYRNLWAAISIFLILLFTGGHMFNHIRSVPYVSGDNKGGVAYFAASFQNQYGIETQIIAALYGLLAFATVSLALRVPRMKDPKGQQVGVFLWSAVIVLAYSFLISIFRIKNGGYPFWLPPF